MLIHPFALSLYAVLALFSENQGEIPFNSIWRVMVILFCFSLMLLVFLRLLTKDWQKSGLLLSLFLLLFLTYGHVYNFLKGVVIGGENIFRHRLLIIVWVIIGALGTVLIHRTRDLSPLTKFANTMTMVLLIFPLYNIGVYSLKEATYTSAEENQSVSSSLKLPSKQPAPDVYFIVMDAYGRSDVLKNVFDFDNSAFVSELQKLGFYVVPCSQSNYARTRLSIVSTLNMNYLQDLNPNLQTDDIDLWLRPYIIHSQARSLFEGLGYKTVNVFNGYQWLAWQDANYYLQPGAVYKQPVLSPFEEAFLDTTLFRVVSGGDLPLSYVVLDSQPSNIQISSDSAHRQLVLYDLNALLQTPRIRGPKFVYVHLVLPHPPFVFGPNGEDVNLRGGRVEETGDTLLYQSQKIRNGYRDQVIYANGRIIPILRSIIEESSTPPIIILESDHGPTGYKGPQNRMSNLMAYYLPGKDVSGIVYPVITPVNSFRLVFNEYFGGNYPYLKDVSYFSETTQDINYQIIPNSCTP